MEIKIEEGLERRKGFAYLCGWLWMKVAGWKFDASNLPEYKKFVLIANPHTSNWDLPFMLGCSYLGGLRVSWLGKHTLFRGIGKPFFTWYGGVPVDRTAPKGMVHQVAEVIKSRDKIALAIPPAGTRRKTDGWKTGFYYIALESGVPIIPTYLDWGTKRAGFGPAFFPTGDIEADFEVFKKFYEGMKGKYPEMQSPVKIRTKRTYEVDEVDLDSGGVQIFKDAVNSMRGKDQ